MIKGDAVWNLTFLFLQMWQSSSSEKFNYDLYRPTVSYMNNGLIQPFGDGPLDLHQTIEMVYMQMINNAKKYVYITTPYLVLDNEIATSLKTAAISGVDVRIMMPHIPDKKLVFYVSQSYYTELIEAGVKIFEYIPGFLHSKTIVADDEVAMIGTANLDYRSFYLHFEVSCLLYQTTTIIELKDDFLKCQDVSHQVTYEECMKRPWYKKLLVAFLRAFSPMI
jgi:cardiolipin synthase